MGKTKEQCINIISEHFGTSDGEMELEMATSAMEESIKEICSAEFALVWTYCEEDKSIKAWNREAKKVLIEQSIFQEVFQNKNGFFDNHISSHRHYSNTFDNPFNINIKSILIYPVQKNNTICGFLTAYNSITHKEVFQRYDLRCLGLLNAKACKILERGSEFSTVAFEKKDIVAEVTSPNTATSSSENKLDTKVMKPDSKSDMKEKELAEQLKLQEEKNRIIIEKLEEEFLEKERVLLEKIEEKELHLKSLEESPSQVVYELEPIEDTIMHTNNKAVDSIEELSTILDFLNNEVVYFANSEHHLYLFLELIKKSLHNTDHVRLINGALENSMFLNDIFTELHNEEVLTIEKDSFNIFNLLATIVNLYTRNFYQKNIIFNVFINPHIPSMIYSDQEKVRSLFIHLLNNAHSLVEENGSIHLLVNYDEAIESFSIEMIGLKEKKKERSFKNLFKSKSYEHSLGVGERGLGLSICSNLVTLLNGKMKLATIGEEEHSFQITLPVDVESYTPKNFILEKKLKIAILVADENIEFLTLFQYYLRSFGIEQASISLFKSIKGINGNEYSHLFCFENLVSKSFKVKNFKSVTILKYIEEDTDIEYPKGVNVLSLLGYYGMALQKILFPNLPYEKIKDKSLLKNATMLQNIKGKFL